MWSATTSPTRWAAAVIARDRRRRRGSCRPPRRRSPCPPSSPSRGSASRCPAVEGPVPLLADVSLTVRPGETVGLVGESGSGKSHDRPGRARHAARAGATATAASLVGGTTSCTRHGRRCAGSGAPRRRMIFQDPRAAINPVRRIGDFLTEGAARRLRRRPRRGAADARRAARAGRARATRRAALRQYPHEFSGGMLQRVVIAAALLDRARSSCSPTSPPPRSTSPPRPRWWPCSTSCSRERGMGLLFVTHDLDLAAAVCDRVYVMYAGRDRGARAGERLLPAPRCTPTRPPCSTRTRR